MNTKMKTKTFDELASLETFEERFNYLKMGGVVAQETFGVERYLNQRFYRSAEWKHVRRDVIARDEGCDLAHPDRPLFDRVIIHHMNPITVKDLEEGNPDILDPRFLVTVSHDTHNAIHYGRSGPLPSSFVERRPGDTKIW